MVTFCQTLTNDSLFSRKKIASTHVSSDIVFWKTYCQTLTTALWFSGKLYVKPHLEGHGFLENFLSKRIWRDMVFWKTFCQTLTNDSLYGFRDKKNFLVKPHLDGHVFLENFLSNHDYWFMVFRKKTFCQPMSQALFSGKLFC